MLFQPKPHYDILDGLRGVAALMVIVYHVFECFDWTPVPHGYLAVDFFFVLSGFVIGYAYDINTMGLNIRGSHEIALSYCFKLDTDRTPRDYRSVRYL